MLPSTEQARDASGNPDLFRVQIFGRLAAPGTDLDCNATTSFSPRGDETGGTGGARGMALETWSSSSSVMATGATSVSPCFGISAVTETNSMPGVLTGAWLFASRPSVPGGESALGAKVSSISMTSSTLASGIG